MTHALTGTKIFHSTTRNIMAEHERTLREGGARILIHLKTDVKHFPIAGFARRK